MVWPERLCPFAGLREFWVFPPPFFFLDCHGKTSSPVPTTTPTPRTPSHAPLEVSPGSLFSFPPAAWPSVRLPLSQLELKWV